MNPDERSHLENATARRLARLATVPVDTSRLEQRLRKALDEDKPRNVTPVGANWWRSVTSVAAMLMIAGLVGWMVIGGSQAMASPMELTRVHHDVTVGKLPAISVDGVEEARSQLAALLQGADRPEGTYPRKVRCCCGEVLQGDRLAFLTMQYEGEPVTIAMLRGYHACVGSVHTLKDDNDHRYIVHKDMEGIQVTLTEQQDHWVCVMGPLPTDTLIELASQLVFEKAD